MEGLWVSGSGLWVWSWDLGHMTGLSFWMSAEGCLGILGLATQISGSEVEETVRAKS